MIITEFLLTALKSVPPELATVLLAAVPVTELRGALPVALLVYRLPVPAAVALSVAGNILPVYFLLRFIEPVSMWLARRFSLIDRFLQWLFSRTRRKLTKRVEKYSYWALAMFVSIPLPVTGAWTGALAAVLFGLPVHKSFLSIFIGLCLSASLVTLITLGSSAAVVRLLW